ncbi:hypothetical protein [Mycetocola saprophilus]|uniref:hypothetical protein n=1 Tax=Mycetocola saprophilus TaxID=76636 RepID=UPI0004C1E04C|nr:hypothetical protein [Mycetocola saprophilus]
MIDVINAVGALTSALVVVVLVGLVPMIRNARRKRRLRAENDDRIAPTPEELYELALLYDLDAGGLDEACRLGWVSEAEAESIAARILAAPAEPGTPSTQRFRVFKVALKSSLRTEDLAPAAAVWLEETAHLLHQDPTWQLIIREPGSSVDASELRHHIESWLDQQSPTTT